MSVFMYLSVRMCSGAKTVNSNQDQGAEWRADTLRSRRTQGWETLTVYNLHSNNDDRKMIQTTDNKAGPFHWRKNNIVHLLSSRFSSFLFYLCLSFFVFGNKHMQWLINECVGDWKGSPQIKIFLVSPAVFICRPPGLGELLWRALLVLCETFQVTGSIFWQLFAKVKQAALIFNPGQECLSGHWQKPCSFPWISMHTYLVWCSAQTSLSKISCTAVHVDNFELD